QALLLRLIAAFCGHTGRMSASCAAGAVRSQARHRAQIARFLARLNWSKDWAVLNEVAGLLLRQEARAGGTWVFILDQTYVGQQGQKTENTFSRANYRPRNRKGRRAEEVRPALLPRLRLGPAAEPLGAAHPLLPLLRSCCGATRGMCTTPGS